MSFGGIIRNAIHKASKALKRLGTIEDIDIAQKTDDAVGNPPAPDE